LCGNLRHKEISSRVYFQSRLTVEMSLCKLNVHVLRSTCAVLSGGSPRWEPCTAPWMLHGGRTGRIDPSSNVNFEGFYSEQTGINALLCCIGCLTGVLPGWMFGRKAEELLWWVGAESSTGTGPPRAGDAQVPVSPSGNTQNNV